MFTKPRNGVVIETVQFQSSGASIGPDPSAAHHPRRVTTSTTSRAQPRVPGQKLTWQSRGGAGSGDDQVQAVADDRPGGEQTEPRDDRAGGGQGVGAPSGRAIDLPP